MQLKANKVEAYIAGFAAQQARPAIVLLYGRDLGAVNAHADTLERGFLGADFDPLQKTFLEAGQLAEDPARLADEAAAIPMLGGDKFVRVRLMAGARGAQAVIDYLAQPIAAALVVVEAAMLPPTNALRKAVEASDAAMALPCFEDNAQTLVAVIRSFLEKEGFKIDAAALVALQNRLGLDRSVTLRELERLVLYLGPNSGNPPRLIRREDVLAASGDAAAAQIERLVDMVALGDVTAADRELSRLEQAGTAPQNALFRLRQHFQMLHLARGRLDKANKMDNALQAFRPPPHFGRRDGVAQQIRQWSCRKSEMALAILSAAEAETRQTGSDAETLAAYAILRIARGARPASTR